MGLLESLLRLGDRRDQSSNTNPTYPEKIIAIIPYYDYGNPGLERKYLEETVGSVVDSFLELYGQTFHNGEAMPSLYLVIASNGNDSSKSTALEIAEKTREKYMNHSNISIWAYHSDNNSKPEAVNNAFRNIKDRIPDNSLIILVDADTLLNKETLEEIIRCYENGMVIGKALLSPRKYEFINNGKKYNPRLKTRIASWIYCTANNIWSIITSHLKIPSGAGAVTAIPYYIIKDNKIYPEACYGRPEDICLQRFIIIETNKRPSVFSPVETSMYGYNNGHRNNHLLGDLPYHILMAFLLAGKTIMERATKITQND